MHVHVSARARSCMLGGISCADVRLHTCATTMQHRLGRWPRQATHGFCAPVPGPVRCARLLMEGELRVWWTRREQK